MQIRCNRCQRPFAIGKDAIYAAIDEIMENDLNHYNAPCPHCRRVNRISKQALIRAAPGWERRRETEEAQEGEGEQEAEEGNPDG